MLRGLLLKDLLILKKGLLFGLVFLVFYGVIGMSSGDVSFFSTYFVIFFTLIGVSSYALDEQAKWMPYALTTTNRTKLVQSKYLLSFIMVILGFICSFVLTLLQQVTQSGILVLRIPPITWGGLYVSLLFNFILIPIVFKLGSENSRLIMFALLALPTILIFILSKNNSLPTIDQATVESVIRYLPYIGVITILIFGFLSYFVTLKIVKKKDF